jgi:hypothetical protein
VVVCQVRSTLRVSVDPLPLLMAGCVLSEDRGDEWPIPVRQESGFQRHSRRRSVTPTGTGVQAIPPGPCVASLANVSRPLTLGLTSLHPHAVVPSILSDEGQRIVLPAFFQRGRDSPDKTRQTFATAHRLGPTHRRAFRVASGPIVARSAFMLQHWFAAERPSPSARERVRTRRSGSVHRGGDAVP